VNFTPDIFSTEFIWASWLAFSFILFTAIYKAPWIYLKNSADNNILFASCVALWLVWQLKAEVLIYPGLEFHLLLITSITLMFGWAFAFLIVTLVQLILTLQGQADWLVLGLSVLSNGATAIATTYLIYQMVARYLPRHFFIYIFIVSFFGGALSMLVSRLAGIGTLLLGGAYTYSDLHTGGHLAIMPILLFPEAFINGMIMTLLVVYKPHWVSSFKDEIYLHGK